MRHLYAADLADVVIGDAEALRLQIAEEARRYGFDLPEALQRRVDLTLTDIKRVAEWKRNHA